MAGSARSRWWTLPARPQRDPAELPAPPQGRAPCTVPAAWVPSEAIRSRTFICWAIFEYCSNLSTRCNFTQIVSLPCDLVLVGDVFLGTCPFHLDYPVCCRTVFHSSLLYPFYFSRIYSNVLFSMSAFSSWSHLSFRFFIVHLGKSFPVLFILGGKKNCWFHFLCCFSILLVSSLILVHSFFLVGWAKFVVLAP